MKINVQVKAFCKIILCKNPEQAGTGHNNPKMTWNKQENQPEKTPNKRNPIKKMCLKKDSTVTET